jgi:uncharacterized protein (DUF433 family)
MPSTTPAVHSDPDILGGTPVFVGTRVPFRNLIDYLERAHSLDEFLDSFPTVSREHAEAARFSVFLTGDQNLEFQQNISKRRLGVVVLRAASNALEDLLPLVPGALIAIETVQPGQTVRGEA